MFRSLIFRTFSSSSKPLPLKNSSQYGVPVVDAAAAVLSKTATSGSLGFRTNEQIKAKLVVLIDAEGRNRGIVPRYEALAAYDARTHELVQLDKEDVGPNGGPPVCRIRPISIRERVDQKAALFSTEWEKVREEKGELVEDFSDERAAMKSASTKQKSANKNNADALKKEKDLIISTVCAVHDLDVKLQSAARFLRDNRRVRITIKPPRVHSSPAEMEKTHAPKAMMDLYERVVVGIKKLQPCELVVVPIYQKQTLLFVLQPLKPTKQETSKENNEKVINTDEIKTKTV